MSTCSQPTGQHISLSRSAVSEMSVQYTRVMNFRLDFVDMIFGVFLRCQVHTKMYAVNFISPSALNAFNL